MRISEQAASFLFIETSDAPMHAAGISVLATCPSIAAVQQHVSARLDLQPKYRQKLAYVPFNLAQPVWVDDAGFEISHHITEHKADKASLTAALEMAVSLSQPLLPRQRPLWRMHLIKFGRKALLLHIVHHALLNGVSVGDDSQAFFDLKADVTPPQPADWQPQPAPTAMELMAQAIQDNTRTFSAATGQLQRPDEQQSELLRRATESVTRFITEPVQAAPWNTGLVSAQRQLCVKEMRYADVRQIKRAMGGTENDVVLAIVGEAAARYLAEHDQYRDGRHLRIMCPVRIRREDSGGVRGNRISGIFPILNASPTDVVTRHQQVRWETDSIRQSREAQSLQLLVELAPPLPALPGNDWFSPGAFGSMFTNMGLNPATFNPMRLLSQLMPQSLAVGLGTQFTQVAGFNMSCVTVPGAQTTQYFAGAEVLQQLLIPALAGNLGYAVAVSTYARSMNFCLVGDPKLIPDLPRMAELVEEVIKELVASARSLAAA